MKKTAETMTPPPGWARQRNAITGYQGHGDCLGGLITTPERRMTLKRLGAGRLPAHILTIVAVAGLCLVAADSGDDTVFYSTKILGVLLVAGSACLAWARSWR